MTRRIGETDAELRARQHAYQVQSKLKTFLKKLGLKSARGGFSISINGKVIATANSYMISYVIEPINVLGQLEVVDVNS